MKAFRFPLDRVLAWRKVQCDLEEAATTALSAQKQRLTADLAGVQARRKSEADALASRTALTAYEFQTVAQFHSSAGQKIAGIRARLTELEHRIEVQQRRTLEARRQKKLLTTLRTNRFEKWEALNEAESERAAADSWLSRFAVERYTTE